METLKPTVLVIDPLRLKEEINDPKFSSLIENGYRIGTTVLRVEGRDDQEKTQLAIVLEPPCGAPPPAQVTVNNQEIVQLLKLLAVLLIGLLGSMWTIYALWWINR